MTGATGKVGREAVALLAADPDGPHVRVASRDPGGDVSLALAALSPERVTPVEFLVDDPDSLAAAFDGVTDAIVVPPFVPDMEGWHRRVAGAAHEGGCEHAVKVSVTGARPAESDPPPGRIALQHYLGEEAMRASGVPTTVIRPTIYAQHFTSSPTLYRAGADCFYLPTGDAPISFLDSRDVALMAVAILMQPPEMRAEQAGVSYELSGPKGVRGRDVAEILTEVSGRPIAHVDGQGEYLEHAAAHGLGEGPLRVYADAALGSFAEVHTEGFQAVTGREPRSFAEFARDHVTHFRSTNPD